MRKDSLVIFVISVVLTLGIVGGLHYLYLQKQKQAPSEVITEPSSDIGTGKTYQPTIQPTVRRTVTPPAVRRTATAIKCVKPDGTVFWTNATQCKYADLNNRLSFTDFVKPVPRVTTTSKQKSSSQKSESNRQSLKPIPRSMTNACSFPIGMARRIEKKSLRLKDPPEESLWKDSYCRWICEARVENCGNLGDYLRYPSICPRQWRSSKRSCGT